jgi:hypothetical protein
MNEAGAAERPAFKAIKLKPSFDGSNTESPEQVVCFASGQR